MNVGNFSSFAKNYLCTPHHFVFQSFNNNKVDSSADDTTSVALKPFVKKYNGVTKHIHVVPPTTSAKNNIRDWLTNKNTTNCFLQNLYTKSGRDVTAKFYNYAVQWKDVEQDLSDDTSVQKTVFFFLLCHQEHKNRRLMAGFREGQHRFCALVHASTGSAIDVINGFITPDTLTADDFKNVDIQGEDNVPTDAEFRRHMKTVLPTNSHQNIMLNEQMPVEVTFISNPQVDVPILHRGLMTSSRAVSDAKIDSARPSATHQIGDLAETFISELTIDAFRTDIDSSNCSFKPHNRIKPGVATKLYETCNGDVNVAFPAPTLINHKHYVDYCKDPFSDSTRRNMKKLLEAPMVDALTSNAIGSAESPAMQTVPFPITFDKIVHETGPMEQNVHFATGQMRNEIYLAPPIISLIFAQMKNTHPRDIQTSKERLDIILYFIRFHLGAQSGYTSQLRIHGALEAFFLTTEGQEIPSKKNRYCDIFDGLPAAADLCIRMINAAIAKGCNNDRNETDSDMMDKLANQVQCAGNAFKHMDDSVGNAAAKSTIQNLCKSWRIGIFFHFRKNSSLTTHL